MNDLKDMLRIIKIHQDTVAIERDKIDEVIGEMKDLRDCCRKAWNNLQDARDALSELV